MSIAMQIICDRCEKSESCGSGRTLLKAHVVRNMLRDAGWRITGKVDGDFCSDCVNEMKRDTVKWSDKAG